MKYNITQKPNKIYTYSNVSKILFLSSKKALFYSAINPPVSSGTPSPPSIRYSRYPFNTKETQEIQAHLSPINKIVASPDDHYIFSVGEEGELVIYEIKDK